MWTRVNGRLVRTMDYPGVAESIASIERVAKKKEEKPTVIPYEDDKFKWDYDDKGVLCRYNKETQGWEVMEDCCDECGHLPDECDCEDEGEMPKCDYCDKDGIYPQCRGRFVTCEEHILLPSKEEEGKDYHAHDRRLYASECGKEGDEEEEETEEEKEAWAKEWAKISAILSAVEKGEMTTAEGAEAYQKMLPTAR